MRISDWSSDVCSSDLLLVNLLDVEMALGLAMQPDVSLRDALRVVARAGLDEAVHGHRRDMHAVLAEFLRERIGPRTQQIGRASCRARVCQSVYISVVAV